LDDQGQLISITKTTVTTIVNAAVTVTVLPYVVYPIAVCFGTEFLAKDVSRALSTLLSGGNEKVADIGKSMALHETGLYVAKLKCPA
jgi:hypothetical protein